MTNLSFLLPSGETEVEITTQENTNLVDVEINHHNEIRVYGENMTATVDSPKTETHKLLVLTTGQTVDTMGFKLKRLGHVKKHNDFVFHIYEILD